MTVRRSEYSLVLFGDPALSVIAETVRSAAEIDWQLIAALKREMGQWRGLGMAAQQVGGAQRICVAMLGSRVAPTTLINPQITEQSEETVNHVGEGCLSAPGFRTSVKRLAWVSVWYRDERFVPRERRLEGLDAQVIQHELDHLDGVCIADRVSRQQRRQVERLVLRHLEHVARMTAR